MTKIQKIAFYSLTTIISLMFIMGAYPKLMSDPMSVAGFAKAHLPLWFMYFIGVAEIAGAIGLWIPKLQKWAVYGLDIIMVGAIIVTILFDRPIFALMPAVILIILTVLLKLGKKRSSVVPQSAANSTL